MIKKFFQKIQNRLLLLLILSTLIPVSLVGWYGISSSAAALQTLALTNLTESVTSSGEQIVNKLENISYDVLFFSKTPPIQGIIRARDGNGADKETNSTYQNWVDRMQITFVSMMEVKPYYMQLRYIDENGNELVRVNSDGKNIKIVPNSELQNQAHRDYFYLTMKLKPGEIYVSQFNLNQERGKIEIPYKPTIRHATPIFNTKGERKGILIANSLGKNLIDIVKNLNHDKSEQAFMLNQDGNYISHFNSKKEWAYEKKTNENIHKDYSAEVATQILSGGKGSIDLGDRVISYDTVFLGKQNNNKFIVIVNQAPKYSLFASVFVLRKIATIIAILSLGTVLGLGLFVLGKLIKLIRGLIYQISSFSMQILSNMNEQEQVVGEQFLSVNETTATLEKLGISSRHTAEQAEAVAAAARQALTLAQEGTQKVEETLNQMLSLRQAVAAISQQNQRLADSTSQIGNISALANLVSDLATQTNMLALNAAVEAVRAGEYGKGFAVVASEIRKLADESQQAAQKINGIIPEIKGAIDSTVKATEESRKTVAAGVKTAQDTAEAFTGVREACNLVFASNQQISLNIKQQAIAIGQVGDEMNSLNRTASQTISGITQVKVGTQKLNEAALNLKSIV
ncbi:MAG: methyl-accepting chemotaxis protein [Microcoleus sp. PH2017_10_PVI_O_A]|uniref:methyl-accepting chemotaxis protein n=1 Tax=unclassified Microcoleus TaxID=2642155 RepID=UPI001D447796|nr:MULTISPECIES: methyl-accepting chemotaxis protein [unclassified Microcoleus]TAE79956.1 MAG: methyl-accepting chemotaxis protein [Oscillatoriales cyanobacterium]MCC3407844.1 methyl-accepting chemotaxis protein [Microcoleus sp. PH2017_10_PVI_O_A]MCC3461993.1 methyl-accepting chemotaxis protein [Microcoleus sp. PH2017_11_PCY_U_A]MCC3480461.1 methyl-accepting chemotaxis protein [Microcoleus sp. PH2017_12_PCY_D_A]MCC3530250.1 methyl-accepting chemotaxis protein [Microcoleus sp. PH2017_21_RUC_O_A